MINKIYAMKQEIIEEIKETDFLKRAFFFESDDEKDFNYFFADDNQKLQFSHIKWLYMSEHIYATLVGLMPDDSIFTIDDEFEQDIICSSFFDIPFVFAELSVRNSSNPKKSLLNDIKYKQDLDDLKKYVEWCIFNNYPLKEQYLNYFSDV